MGGQGAWGTAFSGWDLADSFDLKDSYQHDIVVYSSCPSWRNPYVFE